MKKQEKENNKGRFFDYNKEIISGEIGALVGSSLGSYLSSLFLNKTLIPVFAVIGSTLGSTILFLSIKIYNKRKRKELSFKSMLDDLKYYTPAATAFKIIAGYPLLYFFTKYFLDTGIGAFYSGALGELFAFLIFLFVINIYRFVLFRFFKRKI